MSAVHQCIMSDMMQLLGEICTPGVLQVALEVLHREFKSSRGGGGGCLEKAKGKEDSSKTTCRETNKRLDEMSRHRYPLCSDE
jgi:hypothetical protein